MERAWLAWTSAAGARGIAIQGGWREAPGWGSVGRWGASHKGLQERTAASRTVLQWYLFSFFLPPQLQRVKGGEGVGVVLPHPLQLQGLGSWLLLERGECFELKMRQVLRRIGLSPTSQKCHCFNELKMTAKLWTPTGLSLWELLPSGNGVCVMSEPSGWQILGK